MPSSGLIRIGNLAVGSCGGQVGCVLLVMDGPCAAESGAKVNRIERSSPKTMGFEGVGTTTDSSCSRHSEREVGLSCGGPPGERLSSSHVIEHCFGQIVQLRPVVRVASCLQDDGRYPGSVELAGDCHSGRACAYDAYIGSNCPGVLHFACVVQQIVTHIRATGRSHLTGSLA